MQLRKGQYFLPIKCYIILAESYMIHTFLKSHER